jgi:hypothetical protein
MVNPLNPFALRLLRTIRPRLAAALAAAVVCAPIGLALLPPGAGGVVVPARAQGADERQAYQKAMADPTISNLRDYIRRFPLGAGRPAINELLVKRQDEVAWENAKRDGTRAAVSLYLDLYPSGIHADEAKRMVSALGARPADMIDYPRTALNGTIMARLDGDAEHCKAACVARSDCAGYDSLTADNSCRLYSSVLSARGDPASSAGARERLRGYQPPPESAPEPPQPTEEPPQPTEEPPAAEPPQAQEPAPPSFNRFDNRDLSGSAQTTIPAGAIGECESFCASNNSCAAYTYNRWAQLCFLKSDVGELRLNARVTSGVRSTYGAPFESSSTITFEHFRQKGFLTSGTRSSTESSPDECENACREWRACIAYTYHAGQGRCDLYDETDEYYSQAGSVSGAKRQD